MFFFGRLSAVYGQRSVTVAWTNPSLWSINQTNFDRNFVLGTAVALAVISSSGKVSPSFEDHLKSTVIGKWIELVVYVLLLCLLSDAKRAWPDLIELSESLHQLFGHSYEVYFFLQLQ